MSEQFTLPEPEKPSTSFFANEPAVATSLSGSVVAYILSGLVTHGVITSDQASADSKTWIPIGAAGIVGLLGFLIRRFVSPQAKVLAREIHAAPLAAIYENPQPSQAINAGDSSEPLDAEEGTG